MKNIKKKYEEIRQFFKSVDLKYRRYVQRIICFFLIHFIINVQGKHHFNFELFGYILTSVGNLVI